MDLLIQPDLRRGTQVAAFRFLDDGIHHVRLPAFRKLRVDERHDAIPRRLGTHRGDDGYATGWFFVEQTHVEIAVHRQRQRPGNRRRAHQQDVR